MKVEKKDYLRILLSETIPSDTPVIFSNNGFYQRLTAYNENDEAEKNIRPIIESILFRPEHSTVLQEPKQSHPFKYLILKSETKQRRLSLLHPRAQFNIMKFLEENFNTFLYYCSISKYSLRKATKVASEKIDKLDLNGDSLGVGSFFRIEPFDRMYKFFDSLKFKHLETRYPYFAELDVANCFNSIYTHTIAWATNGIKYNKKVISKKNIFGNNLDLIIQRSNNNETNGVPIGNEFSRMSAEILFQYIDTEIDKELSKKLGEEKSYRIYRYVDDYMVFASDRDTLNNCMSSITNQLSKFNFALNGQKTSVRNRPYVTDISALSADIKKILSEFDNSTAERSSTNKDKIALKRIYKPLAFSNRIISDIASSCHSKGSSYRDISSLVIGGLKRRLASPEKFEATDEVDVYHFVLSVIEIAFFFYHVSPNTAASKNLCEIILTSHKFINSSAKNYIEDFYNHISRNIEESLTSGITKDDVGAGSYLPFEKLNILLSTHDFPDIFKVRVETLESMLEDEPDINYFDIVSLLYYCKGSVKFSGFVALLEKRILKISRETAPIEAHSEKCHLVLDSLSCPYIGIETKKLLMKNFRNSPFIKGKDLGLIMTQLSSVTWFVDWHSGDLLKSISSKSLIPGY